MNYKKLLPLLLSLIVFVNYENYFKEDEVKLSNKKNMLERRILQEKHIEEKYLNKGLSKELKEFSPYNGLMYDGKKFTYSQAMGELQNLINSSAKERCEIKSLNWSQSSKSELWYDKLRMNLKMECKPKEFVLFTNALRSSGTLVKMESFIAVKKNKSNKKIFKDGRFKKDKTKVISYNIVYLAFRVKK